MGKVKKVKGVGAVLQAGLEQGQEDPEVVYNRLREEVLEAERTAAAKKAALQSAPRPYKGISILLSSPLWEGETEKEETEEKITSALERIFPYLEGKVEVNLVPAVRGGVERPQGEHAQHQFTRKDLLVSGRMGPDGEPVIGFCVKGEEEDGDYLFPCQVEPLNLALWWAANPAKKGKTDPPGVNPTRDLVKAGYTLGYTRPGSQEVLFTSLLPSEKAKAMPSYVLPYLQEKG